VKRRISTLALGAALAAACLAPAAGALPSPNPEVHPFEVLPGSFHLTPSVDGAAAHEDLTTEFDFAHFESGPNKGRTYDDVRSTVVNLPAGFNASNTAVPTCTAAQLAASPSTTLNFLPPCPPGSAVGTITFDFGKERLTVPIFNMQVTSFGVTAQLGFAVYTTTQILTARVRPGDSGLTVTDPEIENLGEPREISVTIWGVPAAHEHDLARQQICSSAQTPECLDNKGGPEPAGISLKPFLSNPTSCGPHVATMQADSWEHPGATLPDGSPDLGDPNWSRASVEVPPIVGCERVPFEPSIEVKPSTRSAESPTGLDVSLLVPQTWDTPFTISSANLKDAKVTLPEGMTANPSLAAGLRACTPAQYESETSSSLPGEGCPAESKIGSIVIETPVLEEKIPGAIYIAKPYENVPSFGDAEHPGGSLLALYVVAKDPERGILIKVAGKITPNETTGQLVTTFLNNPQQPFSKFTLKFRPGATAPLVSPPACGTYGTAAELTPWSSVELPGEAPVEPRAIFSQPFQITQGVREGPCPAGGIPPFKPQAVAGTENNAGGSYSPFYLRITREDGEQEITRFSTIMPPGLTGNLTGIPFCPEAQIEAARHNTGAQELASPSCPAASEVGHTLVGAGVGSVLAWTPGKVYLAGPYHGAPLSLVSVTSAVVGPFDLGTVVIRFALRINPTTAQVEVDSNGSDAIPHIIQGIVVHVRDIHVYIDRPNFILNPTSCNAMSIADTVTGAGADFTNPADQVPVTVSTPFQAADCSTLAFKPTFKVTTSGKTSRSNGASLTAKLTVPAALGTQANITRVKVDLPKQLPSRLTTLQKACTAAQFNANPAGCPAASFIGHAKAITPILPVPLEGPAIFVSHGGEAFPSLIVVLQGYGITIDLVGSTFISKAGITSSTFKTVPDQPVTSFELTLPEGKYSALAANGNLCGLTKTVTVKKKVTVRVKGKKKTVTRNVKQTQAASLQMPTEFVGQNGATIHQSTKITVTGCPKGKKAKKTSKKHKKRKKQ
jgi:hypothetical protein